MAPLPIPGGLLIAIEGIDGAGKTTLAHAIRDTLVAGGAAVTLSKEPTNGPWGTRLRESASTGRLTADDELDLLLKDRREHVDRLIRPALDRGDIVILDRYFPSNVAYQGAAGLDVDAVLAKNDFAPRPDLLLLLDLEPSVGLERIRRRGDKPNHFETDDNLSRCRAIFKAMALEHLVQIDATASAEVVLGQAMDAVAEAMSRKGTIASA